MGSGYGLERAWIGPGVCLEGEGLAAKAAGQQRDSGQRTADCRRQRQTAAAAAAAAGQDGQDRTGRLNAQCSMLTARRRASLWHGSGGSGRGRKHVLGAAGSEKGKGIQGSLERAGSDRRALHRRRQDRHRWGGSRAAQWEQRGDTGARGRVVWPCVRRGDEADMLLGVGDWSVERFSGSTTRGAWLQEDEDPQGLREGFARAN